MRPHPSHQLPRIRSLLPPPFHHLTACITIPIAHVLPNSAVQNQTGKRRFSPTTHTTMRIPYVDPKTATALQSSPGSDIVSRVEARRAPRPLQALDLALLHSPHVADGWNSFLGAVRTKTSLGDDVREVAICRVAVVNRAWYEWAHHAPLAAKGGVSEEGLDILKKEVVDAGVEAEGKKVLGEKLWAVVRYTDEMTRNVRVRDEVFGELKGLFSEQEVVEITATVAAYNCVSRFLVALDVGERNNTPGP